MSHKTVDPNIRIVGFFGILLFLLLGMIFVWRELPAPISVKPAVVTRRTPVPSAPRTSSTPDTLNQLSCERAGGLWASCGSPCHGHRQDGTVCAEVCEPQCLCGGLKGWACPTSFVCTDYEPSAQTPDAMGVCRKLAKPASPQEGTATTSSILPVIPPGMICDASHRVCIRQFPEAVLIENPFSVTGTALGVDTVYWRLETDQGAFVASGTAEGVPAASEKTAFFSVRNFFSQKLPVGTGKLLLLPKGGVTSSALIVPAIWSNRGPLQQSHLSLVPTESGIDCARVVLTDISFPKTAFPVEATLRRLLTPSAEDLSVGTTMIPVGTRLVQLSVSKGVARVVFSKELESGGGGSCRVTAIRAQIEQTLKRFPSISSVIISVEGKTPAETLQP